MKKRIGVYSIIWAICLGLFNLIVFLVPNGEKFSGSFWVGYVAVTVAFIAQLVCAIFALRPDNAKKVFYRLPLISISYTGLTVMLAAGALCMVLPGFPVWLGVILCAVILAVHVIALIKAAAAAGTVGGIDEKVKAQTSFIRELTADAQGLIAIAKTDDLQAAAKKVYEAIRYSDPMSNAELTDIEARIRWQFRAFSDAVIAEDTALANENADALLEMAERRNRTCQLLK